MFNQTAFSQLRGSVLTIANRSTLKMVMAFVCIFPYFNHYFFQQIFLFIEMPNFTSLPPSLTDTCKRLWQRYIIDSPTEQSSFTGARQGRRKRKGLSCTKGRAQWGRVKFYHPLTQSILRSTVINILHSHVPSCSSTSGFT